MASSGAFSLRGKTAIITGAASGIGLATAELFAQRGAAAAIGKMKGVEITPTPWQLDITNAKAVEETFAKIAKGHRRIDILVNNAGISAVGTVQQCTEADMDRCYTVNVKGAYFCLKAAVNHMLADSKGGAIVNLASIASLIGLADRFAYSMSKGAILTMTYSVATDYVKKGIRCNCVCPARIHTPFVDGYLAKSYPGKEKEMFQKLSEYQPIGRMGTPKEVASLILYLSSDEAAFVTGAAYPIDGGVTAKM